MSAAVAAVGQLLVPLGCIAIAAPGVWLARVAAGRIWGAS